MFSRRNQSVFSRWNHRVQTFCIFTAKLCTEFANPDENANFVRFHGQTLQIICTPRKPAASPISSVRKSYSKSPCLLYRIRIFNRKYVIRTVFEVFYCTFCVLNKNGLRTRHNPLYHLLRYFTGTSFVSHTPLTEQKNLYPSLYISPLFTL